MDEIDFQMGARHPHCDPWGGIEKSGDCALCYVLIQLMRRRVEFVVIFDIRYAQNELFCVRNNTAGCIFLVTDPCRNLKGRR